MIELYPKSYYIHVWNREKMFREEIIYYMNENIFYPSVDKHIALAYSPKLQMYVLVVKHPTKKRWVGVRIDPKPTSPKLSRSEFYDMIFGFKTFPLYHVETPYVEDHEYLINHYQEYYGSRTIAERLTTANTSHYYLAYYLLYPNQVYKLYYEFSLEYGEKNIYTKDVSSVITLYLNNDPNKPVKVEHELLKEEEWHS